MFKGRPSVGWAVYSVPAYLAYPAYTRLPSDVIQFVNISIHAFPPSTLFPSTFSILKIGMSVVRIESMFPLETFLQLLVEIQTTPRTAKNPTMKAIPLNYKRFLLSVHDVNLFSH